MSYNTLGVGVIVLLLSVSPGLAQQQFPQFFYAMEVHVHPAKIMQFESYVRQVQDAARQIGDPVVSLAFQTVLGGASNRYFFGRSFDTWAEMDAWKTVPEILMEAHGEEGGRRIYATGLETIASVETVVQSTQHSFTSATPGAPVAPFYNVIRTEIRPDRFDDYMMFLSHFSAAERAAGRSTTRRSVVQGPALTFVAIRALSSHAERDRGPGAEILEGHVGENQASILFAGQREAIVERETITLRFREDLSRIADN